MIAVQHSSMDDRIYFKQALSLRQRGYDVSIITANEEGNPLDMSGNQISNGEDERGIVHYCVQEPKDMIGRNLKRLYLGSFYRNFVETAINTKAGVFVAHEPQSILIARRSAEVSGGKYAFDSHESLHFDNPKDKFAFRKEMKDLKYFTASNERTRRELANLNPGSESETIFNASIIPSSPLEPLSGIVIAHEGSLSFDRGLRLMMDAFILLKSNVPDFHFKIVGELRGQEKLYFDKMITENDLQKNIEVTGWQEYEDVPAHLQDCAIGLITYTPTPNNLYSCSNKLFNYMASNMCVVTVDLPETSKIVEQYEVGFVLKDREPESLARKLTELIANPQLIEQKRNAAHQAHEQISWERESEKLIRFYDSMFEDSRK